MYILSKKIYENIYRCLYGNDGSNKKKLQNKNIYINSKGIYI